MTDTRSAAEHRDTPTTGLRRRRPLLLIGLVVVLLVAAGLIWRLSSDSADDEDPAGAEGWTPSSEEELMAGEDALHRRVVAELQIFTEWLEANDSEGYIGEIGIPYDGEDVDRWLLLAERWFQAAGEAELWVDVWSAGEWWGTDYPYSTFLPATDEEVLSISTPTGELLSWEARNASQPRGVNLSGAEFGAPGSTDDVTPFSNENPGVHDEDYHYDSRETIEYLASQGLDTIRLPFRWERIQPQLGEPLDQEEVARLRTTVDHAEAAGLDVILDVHNYGAYHLSDGSNGVRQTLGSPALPGDYLADLWTRLSDEFGDHPAVVAYGLMNEPANFPEGEGRDPAEVWEDTSQTVVDAIRANGDDTLLMVPGYRWSNAETWAEQHPDAWITDPADNFRYEAHHYWQDEEGGAYEEALADAVAGGY